jgi:hypothetical protein
MARWAEVSALTWDLYYETIKTLPELMTRLDALQESLTQAAARDGRALLVCDLLLKLTQRLPDLVKGESADARG